MNVCVGNLCFHTAIMQCLVNTSDLPKTLWQSFPAVPSPPNYAQHEPLSEFVAPSTAKPQGAKAAEGAVQGNATDSSAVPAKTDAVVGDRSGASSPSHESGGETATCRAPSASSSTSSPRNSTDEGSTAGSVVINEARLSSLYSSSLVGDESARQATCASTAK